ncbi:TetR/AcrR family transcriptional regulator [Acinetobacter baumannii]|uniref:TetR/AcrR family transcriptional regulator n=1 Tax=Acinetobacter baumannii TaxID=470 RepID=UPI00292A6B25|nr:TetR/AcrR family transcriptional regulator [Acinetobacter baumannii]WNX71586.1 TetR/AcrR family transcriptional regulator [Acinetobacter baumannii]HEC0039563.1 TetR/AcrR family transcriptional regulator [Acinetobacter baumannii]HEC0298751.1 TetR/AcrR family transcriptional regulator [Acinetobacter baumannii]
MLNLEMGGKEKQLLETSSLLFSRYGFNNVGVDTIVKESKVSKMTLYQYFESKEKLVEICLVVHKNQLIDKIEFILDRVENLSLIDKLKKIFYIHVYMESSYLLIFKAIVEIKLAYPVAYEVVKKYRTWLINTIYQLISAYKKNATYQEAHMFLFIIDGAMTQLLSPNHIDDRESLFDYYLLTVFASYNKP